MKLPITSNPKPEELKNLLPEHIEYLESLDAQIELFNKGEGIKPEIPADVRAILYHLNSSRMMEKLDAYRRENF